MLYLYSWLTCGRQCKGVHINYISKAISITEWLNTQLLLLPKLQASYSHTYAAQKLLAAMLDAMIHNQKIAI